MIAFEHVHQPVLILSIATQLNALQVFEKLTKMAVRNTRRVGS